MVQIAKNADPRGVDESRTASIDRAFDEAAKRATRNPRTCLAH